MQNTQQVEKKVCNQMICYRSTAYHASGRLERPLKKKHDLLDEHKLRDRNES